jgi:hypothetical protein
MTGTTPFSPSGTGHDFLDVHQSARARVESVPAPACAQPGGLIPLGSRGAGARPQARCDRRATLPAPGTPAQFVTSPKSIQGRAQPRAEQAPDTSLTTWKVGIRLCQGAALAQFKANAVTCLLAGHDLFEACPNPLSAVPLPHAAATARKANPTSAGHEARRCPLVCHGTLV